MGDVINTKAEYLLEDVTFDHDKAHLAYTLGTGAASGMNEAYLLKSDDINLTYEQKEESVILAKGVTYNNKRKLLEQSLEDVFPQDQSEDANCCTKPCGLWVDDFSDEYVYVYYSGTCYQVPYMMVEDKIAFSMENMKEVVRQEVYIPVEKAEKKLKTIGTGEKLPASDFAYVGDPQKVDTWALPIHDKSHVRNAVARFNQTDIPADKVASVKRKVRAAYKKFFPENEIPEVIKSLEVQNDALSVSNVNKADTGKDKKDDTVTDIVELSKSEHDELLEMKKALDAYKAKEAEDLKKSKEDIVKTATFIENQEEVVEAIIKSEQGVLIESLIVKAVEAVEKAVETIKTEMQEEIDKAKQEAADAKEKSEVAKADFAKPEGIEGDNTSLEDTEVDVKKSNALADFIKSNYK